MVHTRVWLKTTSAKREKGGRKVVFGGGAFFWLFFEKKGRGGGRARDTGRYEKKINKNVLMNYIFLSGTGSSYPTQEPLKKGWAEKKAPTALPDSKKRKRSIKIDHRGAERLTRGHPDYSKSARASRHHRSFGEAQGNRRNSIRQSEHLLIKRKVSDF